jgi:hypothetical protein
MTMRSNGGSNVFSAGHGPLDATRQRIRLTVAV